MSASSVKYHWSPWVIGIVALLWNGLGVVNFLIQLNPDAIVNYPATERAIIENRPAWATIAFAVAVILGTAASVLLLLRRTAAMALFAVSLAGVIVTHTHTVRVLRSLSAIGPAQLTAVTLSVVLAVFLVWYARRVRTGERSSRTTG